MRLGWKAWKAMLFLAGCLTFAAPGTHAQRSSSATSAKAERAGLAAKAQDLEARGRADLALQIWQQILLSAPNNAEALAGLARDAKLTGNAEQSDQALNHLRSVNPRDPNIARIEAMPAAGASGSELLRAGELAKEGRNDEAMRIYRGLYGDHPPDGDIALAYYQTLYGAAGGKQQAIAGMRALAGRNPGDPRYPIQLGIMLTYDPRTRAEGIRILRARQSNPEAAAAYRQALIWDSANPASAAELRDYLKAHPQDREIAGNLKRNEASLARMNSGIARTPAERAAFAALNANRLDEAERRFATLLAAEPNNGRLAAGMGFLRMRQKNFAGAISYLEQAERNGYKVKTVADALAASRFWFTMGEATDALNANQLDLAVDKFRSALDMNPRSADALSGLAGAYTRQRQYPAAAMMYVRLLHIQPASLTGWRGLFLAYAGEGRNAQALALSARFPAQVRAALDQDPAYLHALAGIDQTEGRLADAQRVLARALSMSSPNDGSTLLLGTRLQYAGILMQIRHYDQALAAYSQIVQSNPGNVSAWEGIVSAEHELGQDAAAIANVEKMPAATYETALADPGFLATLASIYQQANQYDVAQGFLERAEKQAIASGAQPSIALQLQLAGIYLARNNTDQAYAIYRRVLTSQPDRVDAWKGLIAALTATHRNQEALQEIAQIPGPVRRQLEGDIDFLQAEAGAYAATGNTSGAIASMNRVEAYYAKQKEPLPPNVEIQKAWLLYTIDDDRALYTELMRLGGRGDLTVAQRETVQNIWANWSVRRAGAAMDNGNAQRAVEILEAASQAFPNNLTVRKAVAGGFARVGRAREAVAIFKTVPMQDASAGDFEGAIGAALAANDKNQAEIWLRQALDRFGTDPAILELAARYEQARGDNERAADYYRAALAVMPKVSATDRLAHVLVYPEQDTRVHRAVTAADLRRLLDPDNEPFSKTTVLPSLPAYGPDPYNPAPVVLPGSPSIAPAPQMPAFAAPGPGARNSPSEYNVSEGLQAHVLPASADLGCHQTPWVEPDLSPLPRGARYARLLRNGGRLVPASWTVTRPAFLRPAIQASSESLGQVGIVPDPPHSLASDAWKGLVFSLMAAHRNAEALAELGKIPYSVRRLLDADIEWVQGIASLYFAVGDTSRARLYLNRVENYYLVHRAPAPASLELQRAWLLYNLNDSTALYPLLLRLDSREDLTATQRQQVQNLWADWAVRQADSDIASGRLARGVGILEAASQDYPDNMTVRLAVAGAYARLGRAQEAVTLYKSLDMNAAGAGDFQGAVSAAMSAGDMAQAETWLRTALGKYPGDPAILGLAARFEQARGNNERASAFWRATIAALPPGSSVSSLDSGLAMPPGTTFRRSDPGDTKRLLDPRLDASPGAEQLVPLPSYGSQTTTQAPIAVPAQSTAPSQAPLPLPSGAGYLPGGQEAAPPTQPVDLPQAGNQNSAPSAPALAELSADQRQLTGRVELPPGEETVSTTEQPEKRITRLPPLTNPEAAAAGNPPAASQGPTSAATLAQVLFAEETDSQLTQSLTGQIHNLSNAPVGSLSTIQAAPSNSANQGVYGMAQYTPSAQEAATGAYSAPPPQTQPALQPAKPRAGSTAPHRRKSHTQPRRPAPALTAAHPAPAAVAPSVEAAPQAAAQQSAPISQETTSEGETSTGLSDQELEQRNLPPLRGPWVRLRRQSSPLSPRDEAEMQLQAIESSYSGWLGGSTLLNYRTGDPGYSQLAAIEAPFEASAPLGLHARITAVARPVFLDSSQATGNSVISVIESTVSGTCLVTIPQPIGTDAASQNFTPCTSPAIGSLTPPAQQNAVGLGGELQLAFPTFAIAAGYTPYNFLVSTFMGRAMWRPGNGPITFSFTRDSEKDSQLSYAGLRDPAGNTLGNKGQIWGGVVYNDGHVQIAHSDAQSGFYFAAGGQYLTGYHVLNNDRVDGDGGAWWRVFTDPEYGNLNVGANFFAMHYANNQNAFTHGMGGYFSPQGYFLANVPFTWSGHYINRWHYNVEGAVGVQAFQQDAAPLWPLAADKPLEISQNSPMLPNNTTVSGNYDFHSQAAYQFSPHWFVGGYLAANNSRNYTFTSVGFFVRFVFRAQPSTATTPTGLFPWDGFRPFSVP